MKSNIRKAAHYILSGCLIALAGSCADAVAMAADPCELLIANARIIDGSGDERFDGSILICDGLIRKTGAMDRDTIRVQRIIDAAGKVAAPGFIDTHAHGNPEQTPLFENFLSMGVTTISLGQDGSSPQVLDITEWLDAIDQNGSGVNILHFKGHGTLRRLIDAPLQSGLGKRHLSHMQSLVEQAMRSGSFGLTTGLEYLPGSFADIEELVSVAEPVARHGGLIMSHLRSEDEDRIRNAVRELILLGGLSGAAVHISHIKIVHGNDPAQAEQVLQQMKQARSDGIRITADIYPYTASYTGIGIVFPEWARYPNDYQNVVETRREELAGYLRDRIARRNGPQATLFGSGSWPGMTLAEVADSLNKPFEDVLIDEIGPRGAHAAYFVMSEEVMKRFLQDPHVMVGSDGSPTMQHPRGYGSFARIISRYVRQENLLTLEEAVQKMSGLPAATLQLDNPCVVETPRGLLREGFAADLVIFDPEQVHDRATFSDPHRRAEGFDWVLIGGVPVIEEGRIQGVLPGKTIRRQPEESKE